MTTSSKNFNLCADNESKVLRSLLYNHESVFANSPDDHGHTKVVQHPIETGNVNPIRQPSCGFPSFGTICSARVGQLPLDREV